MTIDISSFASYILSYNCQLNSNAGTIQQGSLTMDGLVNIPGWLIHTSEVDIVVDAPDNSVVGTYSLEMWVEWVSGGTPSDPALVIIPLTVTANEAPTMAELEVTYVELSTANVALNPTDVEGDAITIFVDTAPPAWLVYNAGTMSMDGTAVPAGL